MFTNGFWDEHEKTLHWNRPIPKDVGDATSVLPAICYAAWVDVNDEFQTERFGGTILADGDLYLYCLWKAGLTDDERSQWDDAISQCTPGSLAPLDDLNWDDQEHKEHGLEMIREAMGLEDDK